MSRCVSTPITTLAVGESCLFDFGENKVSHLKGMNRIYGQIGRLKKKGKLFERTNTAWGCKVTRIK